MLFNTAVKKLRCSMAKKIKSKQVKTPTEKTNETFEVSMEKLDAIVRELEGGNLGLTDSLEKYEQGVRHLKQCYRMLEQAERKVQLLTGVDREGNPVTVDFDDQATTQPNVGRDSADNAKRPRKRPQNMDDRSDSSSDDIDDSDRLF